MAGELAGSKVKAMEEESEREGVGEGAITQGGSVNCKAYGRSRGRTRWMNGGGVSEIRMRYMVTLDGVFDANV
jgi:hypothetical protein